MCGISAIISSGLTSSLLPLIEVMSDQIRHRGPDGEGYLVYNLNENKTMIFGGKDTNIDILSSAIPYTPSSLLDRDSGLNSHIALGHRRLAIVDLTPTGHQPMSYANGRYWITYNGEVYNYIEIRNELIEQGYSFISESDTEVILAAYDCWGNDCLNRFNGMFAFVLLDLKKREAFIARDRFGVKPLYYWISPEGLIAFASEIKQFTVLPGWNPKLNGIIAYDFLCYGVSDHSNETFFDGVFQLSGGEALVIELDRVNSFINFESQKLPTYQWYELQPISYSGSFEEAVLEYRDLFIDAVRLRLRADVPVGSCLSGGLDSSSIVCAVDHLLDSSKNVSVQKTFSACSHLERFDERPFIEEVVRQTEVDAHYTYPALDNLFELFDRISWHQDEPFGSTSIYAQWMVFKLAADNNTIVMLDGQGGDEQLTGYHASAYYYFAELLRDFKLWQLSKEIVAMKRLHGVAYLSGPKIFLKKIISSNSNRNLGWLNSVKLGINNYSPSFLGSSRSLQEDAVSKILRTSLPKLLHWEDRDSMAHSVESRVPFVDYRLMEYALSLPSDYRFKNGSFKRILREALKGILPEKIRMRNDKMGFVTPEEYWLKEEATELFKNEILKAVEITNGLIKPEAVLEIDQIVNGVKGFTYLPWRIISLGRWVEVFRVNL